MKKFMKGCIVIALVLLILGFALAIMAGTAEGTEKVNDVVESVTGGKVHINLGNEDGWGIIIGENEWNEPEALFDIEDNTIFDGSYEVLNGNVEKYAVGSDIAKLDIEAGGCAFYWKESDDGVFYLEASNAGKVQCFLENDTLYVKSTRTVVDDWDEFSDGEITLYIPEGYRFEEVSAELGAGLMEMNVLTADKVDLEVGAGQITVEFLQSAECDMEVGMGEIIVDDMQVTKLNGEVGMGHLQMKGTILGDVEAECSMGSLELVLSGSAEEFNYKLEAAMGNVSLDGTEYSGMTQDKTVMNSANKNMTLKCAMGNLEVRFED